MGLDMYLTKRTYVQNWDHYPKERKTTVTVKRNGKNHPYINSKKISYITEEVAYWRKSNAIHDWIVRNCAEGEDDCKEVYVDRAKLQELLDACILVRDNTKLIDGEVSNGYHIGKNGEKIHDMVPGKVVADKSVAEELLPTSEGFFFGSTDYNEYYMEDINRTIEILEAELKIEYADGFYEPDYYYRASW